LKLAAKFADILLLAFQAIHFIYEIQTFVGLPQHGTLEPFARKKVLSG